MKKALGTLSILLLSIFPVISYAATEDTEINIDDYETLGLKDVLAAEEMEEEFESYTESDDQINIYLFRGNGCTYCRSFLTFLNSITDEYGKYFKLVSFETWYDSNNSDLLEKISEFVDNPAQGVPYIIIGENVFPGYASDYDDSIKEAITTLYNSSDRYDVFEEYNQSIKEAAKKEASAMNRVIIWNFVFTTISTVIIVIVLKMSLNKNNMNNINKDIEEFNSDDDDDDEDDDEDEEEKEVKETKTSKKKKPNKKAKKQEK